MRRFRRREQPQQDCRTDMVLAKLEAAVRQFESKFELLDHLINEANGERDRDG